MVEQVGMPTLLDLFIFRVVPFDSSAKMSTKTGVDQQHNTDRVSATVNLTNPTKNEDKDAVVIEDKVSGLLSWSKLLS